jgi:hypothetical protein
MDPEALAPIFSRFDEVMAGVPKPIGLGPQLGGETFSEQSAVASSPANRELMAAQVSARSRTFGGEWSFATFTYMVPQNGFAEAARTTVD